MSNSLIFKRKSLHLDYFRDDKERICQVLTWHHPPERRLCIVKYDLGESFWVSRETGKRYTRILKSYSLEGHQDNLHLVKKIEPDYLYHSDVYNVDFLAIPNDRISHYYYPEERLIEILELENSKLDDIEIKVKTLAKEINKNLNIPFKNMGITGSILWKAQTEKSDIDFIIYGNQYAQNFNEEFTKIYKTSKDIRFLPSEKQERYVLSFAKKSGLPKNITRKYIKMKKWLSIYDKTNLSLIFSPLPTELPFNYGEQYFRPITPVDVKCIIENSDMGFAYPSIYEINNCEFLTECNLEEDISLKRVISFEGALTGYFSKNDIIVIRGLLEEVLDQNGKLLFYQIILGTKECVENEFIVFEEDYKKLNK